MNTISMFLCGDVMTGRGIDQILPHPGDPTLYEGYVVDAREYVHLAEACNGPILQPAGFDYIWGDALDELRKARPDARIINLETAVTASDQHYPHKEVCYRMSPRNIGCIMAGDVDCCCLGNNHVLDWSTAGLKETLAVLDRVGLAHCGAGVTLSQASAPAVLEYLPRGRVLVFSLASPTSGVPAEWTAADDKPGINFLPDLSDDAADCFGEAVRRVKQPLDIVVASIHWGSNWGYEIDDDETRFAHRLIESGIDVVYGHSSHHVKALEMYRGHLILYGCGDFINDYEGIGGFHSFRPDLTLMYMIGVDASDGRLVDGRLVPMQIKHFRLNRTSRADSQWLREVLMGQACASGVSLDLQSDNSMILRWKG